MSEATLVIMAAGIGSRFGGGIKQLTGFGPNGEIIMDYSLYDALEAGFGKVIFVIRHDLEADFREVIGSRIEKQIRTEYAFQEKEDLPAGFTCPAERTKPWGTGQAILACRDLIDEPFAVINADDYYGKQAYRLVHDFLTDDAAAAADTAASGRLRSCMAGFVLKNTLSPNGGVTRGICRLDERNCLTGVDETRGIIPTSDGAAAEADGVRTALDPESLVSMNFWGFYPDFMDELDKRFTRFLGNLNEQTQLKGEYLLPDIVDQMLGEGRIDVSVLHSSDHWFGVTYQEDVPTVREEIRRKIEEGAYPSRLWG